MEVADLFAVTAVLLTASALLAPVVARAPISFPLVFLGLGLLFGAGTSETLTVDLESEVVKAVAFATLALVLFLDAMDLEITVVRHQWHVPALALGPGAVLVVALTAVAAMLIVDLDPLVAFIVGAVLASTDPVVLRDVVRDSRLPGMVRATLRIEGGTNDLIVLPPILILIAVVTHEASGTLPWLGFLGELLILGPVAGAAVGLAGAWLMSWVDEKFRVQREWQALYGIGLVLAAYAAGETAGADGFLAAFAAGLAVSLSSRTLCDCFLEFGQVLAEFLMLVSFVLFGAILSTELAHVDLTDALLLAALAVFVIRPLAVSAALSLRRNQLSPEARGFIAWFGPRGLNSLLLALIVVESGVPEGQQVFGIVGVVVLLSVAVHGITATPLASWYAHRVEDKTLPEEQESTIVGVFKRMVASPEDAPRITAGELKKLLDGPDPPLVVDVRARNGYAKDPFKIPGAVKVSPDEVADWGREEDRDRLIALYCT